MNLPKVEITIKYPDTKMTGKCDDGRPLFTLQEPFPFAINGKWRIIPAGFEFDYASVPRGLWNTFPPDDPDYSAASLVHDWLYAGEYFPREFNDHVFLSLMRLSGVSAIKRALMFAAVRIGGAFTYKDHTIKTVMAVRSLSEISGETRPLWKAE